MPKVQYTAAKGLVQEEGGGFFYESYKAAGKLAPTAAELPDTAETGTFNSITTSSTYATGAGATETWGLDDGTVVGQIKSIVVVSHSGADLQVTPANLATDTQIVFNSAGRAWLAIWDGSSWRTLLNSGCTIT